MGLLLGWAAQSHCWERSLRPCPCRYPNFKGHNCFSREGCPEQVSGFSRLVADLRKALGSTHLLTAAVRATPTPRDHYNLAAVHPHVDYLALMSYDFHGAFDTPKKADVHTPVLDCSSKKNFHIQGGRGTCGTACLSWC
jgi:GH18 family chitinase